MAISNLSELAQQLVAEQGDDAAEHLAEAIRALRSVGDEQGARLLAKIARHVDELDQTRLVRLRSRPRSNRRH